MLFCNYLSDSLLQDPILFFQFYLFKRNRKVIFAPQI